MYRLLVSAWMIFGLSFVSITASNAEDSIRFYIGTATNANQGGGIFQSTLSLADGKMATPQLAAGTSRSTFLCFHPTLDVLYSVAELSQGDGAGKPAVIAWKVNGESGALTEIGNQSAGGNGPCFVTVSHDGKLLAAANYGSGSVACYPLTDKGAIEPAASVIQHKGSGPMKQRQSEPHAHSVRFSADDSQLLAADLGTDDVFVYDIVDGKLHDSSIKSLRVKAGSGPRHFVFSPEGKHVVVVGELNGLVSVFDAKLQNREPLSATFAVRTEDQEKAWCAEILFHPQLPVVYTSNRGPNEIAWLGFDGVKGNLTLQGSIPCGGDTPRNFRITPDGRWMLVCNQNSNRVSLFSIDPITGALQSTTTQIEVPAPMCIKFVGDGSQ